MPVLSRVKRAAAQVPSEGQPLQARPYWTSKDGNTARYYQGNTLEVLKQLPTGSVQCIVTSPPYWGLRDYGNDKSVEIGSEPTVDQYMDNLLGVFTQAYRVLRDDGTLWLNLGDKYEDGNLLAIPWRVALTLQQWGWMLCQDIIWHKPDPMPESIKTRCTKAHEYVFLLTKGKGYYFDHVPIKEEAITADRKGNRRSYKGSASSYSLKTGHQQQRGSFVGLPFNTEVGLANKRSVWTVSSGSGFKGAHFATFPPKLILPMILAGTSEKGCCVTCGKPYARMVEERKLKRQRPNDYVKRRGEQGTGNACGNSVAGTETKTVGWSKQCNCPTNEVRPCVVLDPFVGSGTTVEVAVDRQRWGWGIELNQSYLDQFAIPRVEDRECCLRE